MAVMKYVKSKMVGNVQEEILVIKILAQKYEEMEYISVLILQSETTLITTMEMAVTLTEM